MLVAWVNHTAHLGGAEHSLLELAVALRRLEIDVQVACPAGPLSMALREAGVPVHELRLHPPTRPPWLRRRDARSAPGRGSMPRFARSLAGLGVDVLRLRRLLRRLRPAVVHANSARSAPAAALAARLLGRPCWWHCRDLAPPGARWIDRLCDHGFAISQFVAASLPPSAHRTVLHNGIDLERFDPSRRPREAARRSLGLAEDDTMMLMVADWIPWKRHDLFLETAAILRRERPALRCVIAGRPREEEPDLGRRLREQARRLGLGESLRWLDDCADVVPLYAAADVLLHPTPDEPFGRVLCEALAMGCRVVAADAGGAAEVVGDCPGTALAGRATPQCHAALTESVLRGPPSGADGRRRVEREFDIRRVADQLAERYRAAQRSN